MRTCQASEVLGEHELAGVHHIDGLGEGGAAHGEVELGDGGPQGHAALLQLEELAEPPPDPPVGPGGHVRDVEHIDGVVVHEVGGHDAD